MRDKLKKELYEVLKQKMVEGRSLTPEEYQELNNKLKTIRTSIKQDLIATKYNKMSYNENNKEELKK